MPEKAESQANMLEGKGFVHFRITFSVPILMLLSQPKSAARLQEEIIKFALTD